MDYSELKRLAEAAKALDHNENDGWYSENDGWYSERLLMEGRISYPKNARFMAAASPDVVLNLLDQNQALLEALKEMVYWFKCDQPESIKHVGDKARAAIKLAEGKDV